MGDSKTFWIFTFGCGQKYEGGYVKVYAKTYQGARAKMIARYGSDWAFQYSEEEWDEWITRRPPYVTPEVEIEVVR